MTPTTIYVHPAEKGGRGKAESINNLFRPPNKKRQVCAIFLTLAHPLYF